MGALSLELGSIQWRESEPNADDGIGGERGADEGHKAKEAGASEVVRERIRTMRASENAVGRRLDLDSVCGRPPAHYGFDVCPNPRWPRIDENRFQLRPGLLELSELWRS